MIASAQPVLGKRTKKFAAPTQRSTLRESVDSFDWELGLGRGSRIGRAGRTNFNNQDVLAARARKLPGYRRLPGELGRCCKMNPSLEGDDVIPNER